MVSPVCGLSHLNLPLQELVPWYELYKKALFPQGRGSPYLGTSLSWMFLGSVQPKQLYTQAPLVEWGWRSVGNR